MRGRLSDGCGGSSLSLPLSALVISRSWGSRTCICFTTMVLSNTCNGGRACASETQPQHGIKNERQIWNMSLVWLKSPVKQTLWAGNTTHQHWAKLDQGLKCAEHHYHHHINCRPWHSDERAIERIRMGGFILEDIGRYWFGMTSPSSSMTPAVSVAASRDWPQESAHTIS